MVDPRRHAWSRQRRSFGLLRPCETNCFIGQALTGEALQRLVGPCGIVEAGLDAIAVAEVELGQIPLQMGFADVLVDAVDAPLQDGEIAFDGVGGHVAARVFLGAVGDETILSEVPAELDVGCGFVGVEAAFGVNVAGDDRMQGLRGHVRDVKAADLPVALHQRHDVGFLADRPESPIGLRRADENLIGFDGLPRATEGRKEDVAFFFHSFTDAMAEEPSGLHAAAEGPLKLAGADTFLAAGHQVDGLKPDAQRDVAAFKNGAHADGEGLAAGVALVEAGPGGLALQRANPLLALAMRADRAVRPQLRFDVGESGCLIVEVFDGKGGLHDGLAPCPPNYIWGLGMSSVSLPDDEHGNAQMARAAGAYAIETSAATYRDPLAQERIRAFAREAWPWADDWYKPGDARRNLVKAGALIVAEIERLDRAAERSQEAA